jgi:hypothetical protein
VVSTQSTTRYEIVIFFFFFFFECFIFLTFLFKNTYIKYLEIEAVSWTIPNKKTCSPTS